MIGLLGWLAGFFVVILLIGLPLALGRLFADRDLALEHDEREALEAEALALMAGQPVVVEVSPSAASPELDASPVEVSPPAAGQGSSPM
ncbi:hypothetical protein ACNOYE_37845 [Nannocystaceae bacterium ST9]